MQNDVPHKLQRAGILPSIVVSVLGQYLGMMVGVHLLSTRACELMYFTLKQPPCRLLYKANILSMSITGDLHVR